MRCDAMRHTLGLLKDALLNTSSYRLVEERVEHVVRNRDRVVRTDVLLELLTATRQLAWNDMRQCAGRYETARAYGGNK